MTCHCLDIKNLCKSYGKRRVVKGVNLSVKTGEIIGLLGPNGAGKTTTFYMITGMIRPEDGDITFDSASIGRLPMYMRARKGIGYLPQEPSIFRKLTVRQNLKAVLELRGTDHLWQDEMNSYNGADKHPVVSDTDSRHFLGIDEEVDKLLDEFNLRNFADRDGYRLSGGERRRAEIARAIALRPAFMLFDEPFAGIDPIAIIELKKMMTYLKTKGLGILITDHNVRETLSITDRAYIISDGTVLAEGTPDVLVNNHEVRQAYLGEGFSLNGA
ncbi:MAG: ABC transporter ATP-binding protein [Dissulfurispiraceae bacterium]|jgi:lipopolysaccharide export system ATP-binding protein|nr:ABC transporter ATP-binding protein [Dissulfurispiraceae bacterium]